MIKIKRALLSVYDKTGIVEFAHMLQGLGIDIISSGGTARALSAAGIEVTPVEKITGQAEIFGGRVKTLTPQIHGGLLMRRDHTGDIEQAAANNIAPIDLLCVNLYPFQETVAREGENRDACVEMIDIGGPAMIRAAAKNHKHVVVVTSPANYESLTRALTEGNGSIDEQTTASLAADAFAATCAYDAAIFDYLGDVGSMGPNWGTGGTKLQSLRYGENPNQKATCYVGNGSFWRSLEQHQGKALSYNNLGDLWAAWSCLNEFSSSACVAIKHGTPCGVGLHDQPAEAFALARDGDALSVFGGVVLFNREIDEETASLMSKIFLEVIGAPSWSDAALALLKKKKNLRLITLPQSTESKDEQWSYRSLGEASLLQTTMPSFTGTANWQCVTGKQADKALLGELDFAWRVCRHVKSNAIVITRGQQTIGLGGGQTSRIDAFEIAVLKAQRAEHSTKGAVLASDAFFPFRDVADRAGEIGIKAIVQPGGSRLDQESIDACNELGIIMYFTGERVFLH